MDLYNPVDLKKVPDHEIISRDDEYGSTLIKFTKAEVLSEYIGIHPWLQTLCDKKPDFKPALAAVNEDPNMATLAILGFIRWNSNHAFAASIKIGIGHLFEEFERGENLCNFEDSNFAIALSSMDMRQYLRHPSTKQIKDNITTLCLLAGLAKAKDDVEATVNGLRTQLMYRPSQPREENLQREINELKTIVSKQRRIITNLTYRHLMEHLPSSHESCSNTSKRPGQQTSSTQQWQTFFRAAFSQAQSSTSAGNHPLQPLTQAFPQRSWKQLERVGLELYGTVSTNIHHFHADYSVSEDQWGAMEGAILKALTPVEYDTEGYVDWHKEAARY